MFCLLIVFAARHTLILQTVFLVITYRVSDVKWVNLSQRAAETKYIPFDSGGGNLDYNDVNAVSEAQNILIRRTKCVKQATMQTYEHLVSSHVWVSLLTQTLTQTLTARFNVQQQTHKAGNFIDIFPS